MLSFATPEMRTVDRVLLCFRSIGSLRDNRQADHPVGLEHSLNGADLKSPHQVSTRVTSMYIKGE